MSVESTSPPSSLTSTSLSPTFEQLSYLDSDPPIPDIYSMSSNESPHQKSLKPDQSSDDYFQQDASANFVPSSTSSEGTWDDYIAWDALRSPVDFYPTWASRTPQASSNVPLFNDFSDSFRPLGESSSTTLPLGQSSASNEPNFNQDAQVNIDALGDYYMSPESSYPSQLSPSTAPPSQPAPTQTIAPYDSGFVSRATSVSKRQPIDLALQTTTSSGSGSRSPTSSAKSPVKRRSNPNIKTEDEPDFKRPKPRKTKSAAHNDVEKRYRTNLNAKITELSASVPSLRAAMQQNNSGIGSENASGDEGEAEPGRPGYPIRGLKKATVLSRATEYIRSLEGENGRLEAENADLRKRLRLCGRIAVDEHMK